MMRRAKPYAAGADAAEAERLRAEIEERGRLLDRPAPAPGSDDSDRDLPPIDRDAPLQPKPGFGEEPDIRDDDEAYIDGVETNWMNDVRGGCEPIEPWPDAPPHEDPFVPAQDDPERDGPDEDDPDGPEQAGEQAAEQDGKPEAGRRRKGSRRTGRRRKGSRRTAPAGPGARKAAAAASRTGRRMTFHDTTACPGPERPFDRRGPQNRPSEKSRSFAGARKTYNAAPDLIRGPESTRKAFACGSWAPDLRSAPSGAAPMG